jgi:glycosyltransferase involved in cell wall biosynthesis
MLSNKLSIVIITYNEEQHIARCLESVRSIADEVIVMDSHSTDRTEEICKTFPVRFISTEWKGYSETKNAGNALASYPYILSLDADECLDAEMIEDIYRLKVSGFNGVYLLNRLTNYCGKWIYFSGWNPDWKIRIFPKELVKWNHEIVHEELLVPHYLKVSKVIGRLHHFSYTSREQHLERANKYSILTAKKYAEQGRKASFLSPYLRSISRFFSMYIFKLGILDGIAGWHIAYISAKSNALKYQELRKIIKKERE